MIVKEDQLHRTEVDHSQWSIFCLVKDPVSCSKKKEVKRFFGCCGKQAEYFLTIPTKEDQLQKMKVWPLPMVKLLFDEASRLPSKRGLKNFECCGRQTKYFYPFQKKSLTPTSLDLPPDPHVWETFQYNNLKQKGVKKLLNPS